MALTNILAHRLTQTLGASHLEAKACADTWPTDEGAQACFKDLKQNGLRRAAKDYGSITDTHAFRQIIDRLIESELGFYDFSVACLENFKTLLKESELEFDYHLIMAYERLENANVLHICFVEQRPSSFINASLNLEQNLTLDSNIKFGAKINLTELVSEIEETRSRSVTLFRTRGEKGINAFLENAIGFGNKQDIGSETETLLKSVNEYANTLPADQAAFAKNQVVEYCLEQEQDGQPIGIKALSGELQKQFESHRDSFIDSSSGGYTPPPKFANFALESNSELKKEIIADKNRLKNYVRISGRNEQLSMSFSSSCLGESIVYDAASDSLTVKAIPASLKARLTKIINSGD